MMKLKIESAHSNTLAQPLGIIALQIDAWPGYKQNQDMAFAV